MATMKNDLDHKTGLSRQRWLELAIDSMSRECKSKFSLDSLLKAMPVSKGSFYWHFKNRADFLVALVEHWELSDTQSVVESLKALPQSATAADKLWELMCIVYEKSFDRYDLLIRSLTLEFPELRQAVAAVDQKRYNTVRQLFAEMGFEGDALDTRTLVFVTTTSMDRILLLDIHTESYERQLKLRHEFFIRP
jgi:AcrR family transcriptional regulator